MSMKFSTKLSAVSSALILAGLFMFGGAAQADQVRANYLPTVVGGDGGGRFTFDREALLVTDTGPEFQGILNTSGGPTNLGGLDDLFYGFCLEPNEYLIDPHTYNVTDLAAAPISGITGAMGGTAATNMRILFGNVYPDFSVTLTAPVAYAIQLAVWEIANEKTGTIYDLTAGNYFAGASAALTTAQGWLDSITDGTWTKQAAGLIALTDTAPGTGQDFVVQVVPIPAAAWLFGSALVGIAGVGRRKLSKDRELQA
jgi:hypothetical protein